MNLGSENTQELVVTNNTINGFTSYLLFYRFCYDYPKENNSTTTLKAKFIEISKNSITANNNIGEMREDAFRKTASLVSSRNIKKTEIGTNSTEILKFSYNIINSKGLVYLIEYNNALVRNRKVMHEVDFLSKKIEIINNSLNSGFKNSILFYNNYSKTTIGFNNTDELNFSSNTVYGYYKNSLIQNVYNGKFTTKGKILNITNNVLRSEVVVGVTYLLYNSSILNIENNEINITNNEAISYKQQTDTYYVKNKTNLSNILYNSEEMNIGTDDSIIVNINYNSILSDITTGSYNIVTGHSNGSTTKTVPENIYKNKKAFLIRNLGILQIKSKRININENEIKVTYEGDSYIHDKDRPYEGRSIISLFMNEGHYRKQENIENSKYPKTKTTSSILKIGTDNTELLSISNNAIISNSFRNTLLNNNFYKGNTTEIIGKNIYIDSNIINNSDIYQGEYIPKGISSLILSNRSAIVNIGSKNTEILSISKNILDTRTQSYFICNFEGSQFNLKGKVINITNNYIDNSKSPGEFQHNYMFFNYNGIINLGTNNTESINITENSLDTNNYQPILFLNLGKNSIIDFKANQIIIKNNNLNTTRYYSDYYAIIRNLGTMNFNLYGDNPLFELSSNKINSENMIYGIRLNGENGKLNFINHLNSKARVILDSSIVGYGNNNIFFKNEGDSKGNFEIYLNQSWFEDITINSESNTTFIIAINGGNLINGFRSNSSGYNTINIANGKSLSISMYLENTVNVDFNKEYTIISGFNESNTNLINLKNENKLILNEDPDYEFKLTDYVLSVIFKPTIRVKNEGILSIERDKIEYQKRESIYSITDYEGNQIQLSQQTIESIFEAGLDKVNLYFDRIIEDVYITVLTDTTIEDTKGILFTGTNTGLRIEDEKNLKINGSLDSFFGMIGVNAESNSYLFQNIGNTNISSKYTLLLNNRILSNNKNTYAVYNNEKLFIDSEIIEIDNNIINSEKNNSYLVFNSTDATMKIGSSNSRSLNINNNKINGKYGGLLILNLGESFDISAKK